MSVNLYQGDCLEVLPKLDMKFQLVIADPLFNVGKPYERTKMGKVDYWSWCWRWLKMVREVMSDNASIFVMTRQELVGDMMQILSEHVFLKFRNLIVWYNSSMSVKNKFCVGWQPILYYSVGSSPTFNFGAQKRCSQAVLPWGRENKAGSIKDLWDDIPFVSAGCMVSKEAILLPGTKKKAHPCQMPEALAERMILYCSNPGDNVLDPMMGSGTVPVVAKRLGRNCVGIEKRSDYYELAKKRVEG